ncbi:MAG: GGDEF domain-containing protein [Rhodoferax sp.]|nr:GGDEF domain-containing protein [Rhodoferax sp.]
MNDLRARLATLKSEYRKVQGEATIETLRRFRVATFVVLPIHVVLTGWFFFYQAPPGRPELQAWAHSLYMLQAWQALVLLFFGLFAQRYLPRHETANQTGVVLQVLLCASYLFFGMVAAMLDVRVGHGIATFLIICQGVAILSLMRPLLAIGMFGMAYLVFLSLLRVTVGDAALMASLHIQTLSTALISLLLSLLMWHQYTRAVLLRRQLSLSNAALLRKQQELEILAQRDALTGLYNRRQFTVLAELELARAERIPGGIALLMVDLDFFKQINDRHGHPAGDEVLRQVSALLSAGVRSTDLVGRMGGEEFIVLLPHTDLENALAVAEKLRKTLRERPLLVQEVQLPVTASFGLTWLAENQKGLLPSLYAAADQALYSAKHGGRDRIEVAMPNLAQSA